MSNNDDLLDPGISNSQGGGVYNVPLPYATATLVLGIISIVGCLFYGVVGLVCGIIALSLHSKDKRLYRENPQKYAISYKNSHAGYVCAIIGTILSSLYFLIILFALLNILNRGGF